MRNADAFRPVPAPRGRADPLPMIGDIPPMKAVVYDGAGRKALEERPMPTLKDATDAPGSGLHPPLDACKTFTASSRALKLILLA